MEEHEINGIVFIGFLLTIMSCTAMILYVRTSCVVDPIALKELLKAKRDISNRYRAPVMQGNSPDDENRYQLHRDLSVFRMKTFTTQYEEQEDEI